MVMISSDYLRGPDAGAPAEIIDQFAPATGRPRAADSRASGAAEPAHPLRTQKAGLKTPATRKPRPPAAGQRGVCFRQRPPWSRRRKPRPRRLDRPPARREGRWGVEGGARRATRSPSDRPPKCGQREAPIERRPASSPDRRAARRGPSRPKPSPTRTARPAWRSRQAVDDLADSGVWAAIEGAARARHLHPAQVASGRRPEREWSIPSEFQRAPSGVIDWVKRGQGGARRVGVADIHPRRSARSLAQGRKMLQDKDRIFTNIYGRFDKSLGAAQCRAALGRHQASSTRA